MQSLKSLDCDLNMGTPGTVAITFDVDWAPEWTIDLCDRICRTAMVPATFFVTSHHDILSDLKNRSDMTELGIHPNFLPASSHGSSPEQVMDSCMNIVPGAVSMRTHSLVQSSSLMAMIADRFEIRTDVSLLLPFHDNLRGTHMYFGKSLRRIVRLPYFWGDDIAALWPGWSWETSRCDGAGLQIYDFHPIHIALNTDSPVRYSRLKEFLGDRPLVSVTEAECNRFGNPGHGSRRFLERLIASKNRERFRTISQIYRSYVESGNIPEFSSARNP